MGQGGIVEAVILFFLAIGGLFLGWFSPTQAGAIGAGGALIIGLVMLLLLTIIMLAAMRVTSLEERMAGNLRNQNIALQAAIQNGVDAQILAAAKALGVAYGKQGILTAKEAKKVAAILTAEQKAQLKELQAARIEQMKTGGQRGQRGQAGGGAAGGQRGQRGQGAQ